MTGVEIDMIISDSLRALEQYEKIFEIQKIEATHFSRGKNEVVFSISGTRFHLLDENPSCQLLAPNSEHPQSVWFTMVVPSLQETFHKAIRAGCTEIKPITKIEKMGVSNAMFLDSFGYIWMLHQVHRKVSFEERCHIMEEQGR